MGRHLTGEIIDKLRRGTLPADEVAPALRHAAECEACGAAARAATAGEAARLQDLLADDAAEPPHHLDEAALFGWVDGTLRGAARDDVRAHLDECALCREDASDLARVRQASRSPAKWLWAAAAAAAIAAIALFTARREPPARPATIVRSSPVAPARPSEPRIAAADPQWASLVDAALESGRLPLPGDLARLRGESDTLRGASEGDGAPLRPAGVYVDEVTPEFRWPAIDGAAYVVVVMDGDREIVRSTALRDARWTPPRPLVRGRTYAWQVEAARGGRIEVLPPPSAPAAKFRIVGPAEHETLIRARAQRPDDHLLLAVLAARAGLEGEAKEHLARLADSPDPRVQRLRGNTRGRSAS